jgi:hypothetical protein
MGDPTQTPLPYADPTTATGAGGYRARRDPSDDAGPLNGRVVDNGSFLQLEPSSLLSRRILALCVVLAAWSAVVLVTSIGNRRGSSMSASVLKAMLFIAIPVVGFFGPMWSARRRGPLPWIVVDRNARLVRLPREKRDIPMASVIRLQLVSFGRVGVSSQTLSYRGVPPSGEFQIVFDDGGTEQTWCVVYWPDADAVKAFSKAFHDATGIPVSRVYPTTTGEWHVEAFDGMGDGGAAAK